MGSREVISLLKNIYLGFGGSEEGSAPFPTSRIIKGAVLYYKGLDLSEEGVGFGVPILKQGLKEFFPGGCSLSLRAHDARVGAVQDFEMNLVERIAVGSSTSVKSAFVYRVLHALASIHQSCPWMRPLLNIVSNRSRRFFGIRTVFEEVASAGRVRVLYDIDTRGRSIAVTVHCDGAASAPGSELIVMNEQGAHHFDRYTDSNGTFLEGDGIESWKEVIAEEATMASGRYGVAFTLKQIKGTRLYRGRESEDTRFAWSGFAYVLSPPVSEFRYVVRIGVNE